MQYFRRGGKILRSSALKLKVQTPCAIGQGNGDTYQRQAQASGWWLVVTSDTMVPTFHLSGLLSRHEPRDPASVADEPRLFNDPSRV